MFDVRCIKYIMKNHIVQTVSSLVLPLLVHIYRHLVVINIDVQRFIRTVEGRTPNREGEVLSR